jgi:uncharacterized protein DUF4349
MSMLRDVRWWSFWANGNRLKTGWMITATVVALYVGAIRPHENAGGIANQRAPGLASIAGNRREPIAFSKQTRLSTDREPSIEDRSGGVIGGVPGTFTEGNHGAVQMALLSPVPETSSPQPVETASDRKMLRTCSLEMIVQKPAEAAEKIRGLAERLGGFLIRSEVKGGQDATGGSLTIRVPAARFEQARAEIRRLAWRVESERIEAQDVTRQYVDDETNLRNLRAEEGQYLAILKQAKTVKDTLDVSEKLSDIRGQMEREQGEFNAVSKQVETVAIEISMRTEAEAQLFGLHWRPLYQVKLALRDGLEAIAEYGASMVSILFCLPAVLLWLGTALAAAAAGWRILRWATRVFFSWPKPEAAQNG